MDKYWTKYRVVIIITVFFVGFYLLSIQFDEWFTYTMPRHQIIQLPLMFLLGVLLAQAFHSWRVKDLGWAISGLIFIFSSIIFWMLPHSVDKAVIEPEFNKLMHVNMIISGALLVAIYRELIFEVKIFFLGMLSAKLGAAGVIMKVFNLLLCSSFDIRQQKETGNYFIFLALVIFISTIVVFFRMPSIKSRERSNFLGY
ncbi:MAG: hypothetical protein WC994_01045 [Brumimicrobium sp.]